jgi:transcriptional regulator with XRE-family HTH domain
MVQHLTPLQRDTFANRLRIMRKERGFKTAKSFAEALGVDQNTYTRYERGEVEPNIGLLERIWDLLQLPSNGLIGHGKDAGHSSLAMRLRDGAIAANQSASGRFAFGLSDGGDPARYVVDMADAAPQSKTQLGRQNALAWRIAQQLAHLGVGTPPDVKKGEPSATMRATADMYQMLTTNPFEAVSVVSRDTVWLKTNDGERASIAHQLEQFAATAAKAAIEP